MVVEEVVVVVSVAVVMNVVMIVAMHTGAGPTVEIAVDAAEAIVMVAARVAVVEAVMMEVGVDGVVVVVSGR